MDDLTLGVWRRRWTPSLHSDQEALQAAEEALFKVLREEEAYEREIRNLKVEKLSFRENVFQTFDNPSHSRLAFAITACVLIMILVSTATFTISTDPAFHEPNVFLEVTESVCVIAFTLEYVVKFATCERKWNFVKKPINLVDLAAILPYYFELLLSVASDGVKVGGFAVIRVVRLTRVFRLFKLGKYTSGFTVITQSIVKSIDALTLLSFLFMITVVFFSSLLFYAELTTSSFVWMPAFNNDTKMWVRAGESTPSPFQSIPMTFWWAIVTMTTCGYGDDVPKSFWGKFVATLAMIVGVLIVAFPITVIAANFSQEWSIRKQTELESKDRQYVLKTTMLTDVVNLVAKENMQLEAFVKDLRSSLDLVKYKHKRVTVILHALRKELNELPPVRMVAPDWEKLQEAHHEEHAELLGEFERLFKALDKDNTGMLPISTMASRLAEHLSEKGMDITPEELEAFVHYLDLDRDGMCDLQEFLVGARRILDEHSDMIVEKESVAKAQLKRAGSNAQILDSIRTSPAKQKQHDRHTILLKSEAFSHIESVLRCSMLSGKQGLAAAAGVDLGSLDGSASTDRAEEPSKPSKRLDFSPPAGSKRRKKRKRVKRGSRRRMTSDSFQESSELLTTDYDLV